MAEHKKGPISPQDQAFQTNNQNTPTVHHIKPPTKKEHVYLMILASGANGITGKDIQTRGHVISGRNYPSELKRDAGVYLAGLFEPNSEDDGRHKRFWIICREDAVKVLRVINDMRRLRYAEPLEPEQAAVLLALYPPAPANAA